MEFETSENSQEEINVRYLHSKYEQLTGRKVQSIRSNGKKDSYYAHYVRWLQTELINKLTRT